MKPLEQMKILILVFFLFQFVTIGTYADSNLPVVIWHGVRENLAENELLSNRFPAGLVRFYLKLTAFLQHSMGSIVSLIQENIPDVYVRSLEIGSNVFQDVWNSFFMNVNNQVEYVCKLVKSDPKLKNGFNAIGFSQGAQFLRAYIQRCNDPPVANLISIGGQHQGVFGIPYCPGPNITLCETARRLIDYGAYIPWIQESVVQAEYWHDPLNEDWYLEANIFLPDINNARAQKNERYKSNIKSLKNFVMVKFLADKMVQPVESEWFGFYKPGQDKQIEPLRESRLYKEDWLGLKYLDQNRRLHFLSTPGDHLQFTDTWFVTSIIQPFLKTNTTV